MSVIPVLTTDRLILRGHVPSDLGGSLALWSDPQAVHFIGGQVLDEQAVWFRLLRHAGQWALLGYGSWVVIERATGAFVGEVGLLEARRGFAELAGAPEMGWMIAAQAQGKGFATEAVRAAVQWSDAHVGAPLTRCIIDPDNIASLHVARTCGYSEKGRIAGSNTALILMERVKQGQAASG